MSVSERGALGDAYQTIDRLKTELADARAEILTLQDILNHDKAIEATYNEAFRRYPGLNDAEDWRAL